MEVYEYLDQVERQIRQEAMREEIRTELRQHIEDQTDFYQEAGMSRKEAVEKAVEDMGDPVETGVRLDMVHQPRLDKRLLGTTVIWLVLQTGLQIFYLARTEWEVIGLASATVIVYGLGNSFWFILSAKRSFFSMKCHETSNWFSWWLVSVILAAVFQGITILRREAVSGSDFSWYLQEVGCIFTAMLPAAYGGLVFGWREKKKGFFRLLAVFAVDLAVGFLVGGGIYMALLIPGHIALLSMGIKKNWYGGKRRRQLGRIWFLAAVLFLAGLLLFWAGHPDMPGKEKWQRYLETPDLPGILKNLTGGYFGISLCICGIVLLVFYLWILWDLRSLTNELCRMLCTGIFFGFCTGSLFSLAALIGLGPYGSICFPLLSVSPVGGVFITWYYYYWFGIFLNCHKSDRIIPKKIK